ncbi:MAG: phage tail tape measure protein family [Frankiales bacterium]|nr:phage tail tape measure protein family [Frankiales bacterium]
MAIIGDAELSITADTSNFGRSITRQARGLGATVAAGLGVASIVKSIFTIGTSFQDTLNTFGSVADKAQLQAAGGLAAIGSAAKVLGNDLSLPATSAADAGVALTELAKAGLSVKDSLAAAKGTLQLSTAANISAGDAATITANALNTFALKGTAAADVANVLANAANVSSGEVTDFAQGLAQGGLVAKQAGLSIQETAGTLALFANNGLKGSDAGTSLKTALLRLQAPTKDVQGTLKSLGINVRDASGNMKPLSDIAETLKGRLSGLTSAQRDAALSTIFGSDAIRAGTLLYNAGGAGVDKYTTAVSRAGGAQEVAAAKSQGLGGAFRGLQSQIETVKIDVFEKVAPSLEAATRAVSDSLPGFVSGATAVGGAIKSGIGLGLGQLDALVDLGPLRSQLADVATEITSFFTTLTEQPQQTLDLGSIVSVDHAALAGPDGPGAQLALAIKEGIDGGLGSIDTGALAAKIGTVLAGAASQLTQHGAELVGALGKFFADVAPDLALAFGKSAPTILLGLATGLLTFDVGPLFTFVGNHLFDVVLGAVLLAFAPAKLLEVFGRIPLIGPLVETTLKGASAGAKVLVRAGSDLVGGLIRGIEGAGPAFVSRGILLVQRFGGEARTALRLGLARLRGDLGAFPGQAASALRDLPGQLGNVAGKAVVLFVRGLTALPRLAVAPFRLLPGQIGAVLSGLPGQLVVAGAAVIGGFVSGIRNSAGQVIGAIKDAITDRLPGFVKKALGINSPSRVFAELGDSVGEGFALGITRSSSLVGSAVQQLAADALHGVTAADLAAAAARAALTDVDKAATTRGGAASAVTAARAAAATAAAAAGRQTPVVAQTSAKALADQTRLTAVTKQLAAARAAAAAASRGGLANAREYADEARAASQAADALPAHTKAQIAAKNAAVAHAQALSNLSHEATRDKQAAADHAAAVVAELVKEQKAATAAAAASKARAKAASDEGAKRVDAVKDANAAVLKADTELADAQSALADAVYKAQAEASAKAREAAVADAKDMLDLAGKQIDALLARSSALKGAFSTSILQGSGLGDLFTAQQSAATDAVKTAADAQTSAARDVASAQEKVTAASARYSANLVKQQQALAAVVEEEQRRRGLLQAATLDRATAEANLAAARAVATDGAAASAFELENLRGAYAAVEAAKAREADASGAVADAAGKTADVRAQQVEGLSDLAEAQADLATAQAEAAASATAYAQAQQQAGSTVAGVVDALRVKMTEAKAFAVQLGTLAGLGLNDQLLTQVAQLGPQAGSALAAGIIAAGPPTIVQVNSLTSAIGDVATNGLNTVADSLYGQGVAALGAYIDGIRARFPELDATVAELRAKLGDVATVQQQQPAAAAALAATPKTSTAFGNGKDVVVHIVNGDTVVNASGMTPQQTLAAIAKAQQDNNADIVRLVKAGVR